MRPALICYNGCSLQASLQDIVIMKKEAIFAIIIGIIVGLGITFAIYRLKTKTSSTIKEVDEQINQKLLITSPQDESILSSTSLRISGTAEPNEMIVIFVNDEEYITQADSIGAFAQDVKLDMGGNIIQYTAISTDGKQTTLTQNVVVSTDSLDEKVEDSSEDASSSAEASESARKSTQ
jgi:hypothetical protein